MATLQALGRLRYWIERVALVRKAYDSYVTIIEDDKLSDVVLYKAYDYYTTLADETRTNIVKMIVRLLWNRYLADTKKQTEPLDFASWLEAKKTLEQTYNGRFQMRVRRRWAIWQVELALNAIFSYENARNANGWFIALINELLNKKVEEYVWEIVATIDVIQPIAPTHEVSELDRRRLTVKGGMSLKFRTRLRPELLAAA